METKFGTLKRSRDNQSEMVSRLLMALLGEQKRDQKVYFSILKN